MKKIIEGKEMYSSKKVMMKHEKKEAAAGKMTGTKTLMKIKKK